MPKRIRDLPAEYGETQRTIAEAIGARLRLCRDKRELTQEHMRARLEQQHVHITRTQYSRIENGDRLPNAAELIGMQAVLDVSFEWLLLGTPPESENR